MKHLVELINEGNIDRMERKYREFCDMCKAYDVDPKEICVHKTSKGNWSVWKDGKKVFLVSGNILDDELVSSKDIKVCNESLNESQKYYRLIYLTYDPVVQSEYEDGDVDEDELHDSANEYFEVNPVILMSRDDKSVIRDAKKNIKKIINRHPEICGGRIYKGDDVIENIFI